MPSCAPLKVAMSSSIWTPGVVHLSMTSVFIKVCYTRGMSSHWPVCRWFSARRKPVWANPEASH
jgi:hypothetical protein